MLVVSLGLPSVLSLLSFSLEIITDFDRCFSLLLIENPFKMKEWAYICFLSSVKYAE